MGPPFQALDMTGLWLLNPQFELHVSEPRTLIFITVGQPDTRAHKGSVAYADPVGFCVVPMHLVREKGSSLTRQVSAASVVGLFWHFPLCSGSLLTRARH